MRKVQKEQLLQVIDNWQEALQEIDSYLQLGNLDAVSELLVQCQEAAIEIGNFIEEVEEEKPRTIELLEKYCERLYEIYEKIGQGDCKQEECSLRIEGIRQLVIQIDAGIRQEIKVREEVVFLPYKASMWDSLESVYLQVSARGDCDAYVIPIPYFDKVQDGTFGQMHYEGDQYPENIPITHYEEYDIESRHPDKIYIMNPYDNCNLVTSVHPFFYAKNLAKMTDELIYIPYYVLAEPNPDNQAELEGIATFVNQPGVFWSHKVIVQSEAMRQAYINILVKTFGEESRERWEKKIIGSGSPKIDKLLRSQREEQKIPPEWERKIRKTDGSQKKIILYNTSLTAFLQEPEKMIRKIQNVLQVFYKNREQVTLLWRPHPLLKTTICSLHPELQAEYEKIVETYIEQDWGIYDDTADLDRAIVMSDAYYGDSSSVVQLYKATGKPIMIQNVYVLDEK